MYTVRVGPDMVWRRHLDQLLEATARSTTAKESMAREDSEEVASTAPEDFDGDIESTWAAEPQPSSTGSGSPPRRYPERNRRAPQRLDL